MRVPFIDLPMQIAAVGEELHQAVRDVIDSGTFSLGPAVSRFEESFAAFHDVNHCIGVSSGTSALHLTLAAFEIGPGDEVITTPHTWISTAWSISYVGATPVFVDIDPETYMLRPELVEQAITSATRAILPVHLYGQAAPLVPLRDIALRHGLILIEDASQAHGALVDGRRVGSFGNASCFSFYPAKNLGAFGEAGAVITNNASIAERLRQLRDHAQAERHYHTTLGYNARMDAIQAAVLEVKLGHLDHWNKLRQRHARHYLEQLAHVESIDLPAVPHPDSHVWHLFVVLVDSDKRESIRAKLQQRGIATAVHYPTPVPLQPAYAELDYRPGDLPVAEHVMRRCLSLPIYPEMTSEQVEYVADSLADIVRSGAQTPH